MTLEVWAASTCPLLAISDKGATGALWELSIAGSPKFYYTGQVLTEAPLSVYYGTLKLTQVTEMVALVAGTWLWGNHEGGGLANDTIYVNAGASIELAGSEIVYMSLRQDIIPVDATKDRVCIGSRISNNSGIAADLRVSLYTSADVFVARVLPVMTLGIASMIDDSSKLAIPKNYKVCVEAGVSEVSVVMSGDEY